MDLAGINILSRQAHQAYQFEGRIEYNSFEYARVSQGSGEDVLEIGKSESLSIEFTLSMLQERSATKISANLPNIPQDPSALGANLDTSPEATADRIVDFATGFLGAFAQQHPELSEDEALMEFMDLIRSAIEEGFAQAREIIEAMNAMTGELDDTINQTYDLVQQKLDEFYDLIMQQIQAGQEANQETEVMAA